MLTGFHSTVLPYRRHKSKVHLHTVAAQYSL
jgi:hypothetical protein